MNMNLAKGLMVSVILARSTSFLFSKISLAHMGLFELLGLRFFFAFLILFLIFHRRMAAALSLSFLKKAAVLGFILYLVMGAEMMSLKTSDIYFTAFLENMAFAFVPFILWAAGGKRPSLSLMGAILVMGAGVGCLTLKGGGTGIHAGLLWGLAAALFYGLFIMETGKMASAADALTLGAWQMGVMGILDLATSVVVETPVIPSDPASLGSLLALTLLCSAFGFTFQTVAQKYISSEDAGFLCALDPLFASVWGFLFLGENPDATGCMGALLVLVGMVAAQGSAD
ncbi:DMT family transporter [uncultured Dialister sp.]|jgi:drug/metabolite transporter (DMT)-like permease|uniref:DMT family transporter n=1 Tax=uncultured Dialister sp. TaxID=278064 RepID=UPI0025CC51A8|nr:DMT family transporter [uncultured Dialister sp.]